MQHAQTPRATVHVASPEAMRELGAAIGSAVEPGDLLLLDGEFGAGKTTFVQGLARGLGITSPVSSPSFVLENQYQGRLRLYHVDLYRLERLESAFIDELEEHLFADGVSAVEWPEHLPVDLRAGATLAHFVVEDDEARRVEISGNERLVAAARGLAQER